jgi:hypothetical protein
MVYKSILYLDLTYTPFDTRPEEYIGTTSGIWPAMSCLMGQHKAQSFWLSSGTAQLGPNRSRIDIVYKSFYACTDS